MTFFPIRHKPEFDFSMHNMAAVYPNAITKEMAEDIIKFATTSDGWHRRGSKTAKFVEASFTTCLLHDLTHPAYEHLDKLWQRFTTEHQYKIDFIEYYEIKEYKEGDGFGIHRDNHGRIEAEIDRKFNLIIQLSEPTDYEGGVLHIGKNYTAPKDFGTAIFFPASYLHMVSKITSGTRYILIGHAWGPNRLA